MAKPTGDYLPGVHPNPRMENEKKLGVELAAKKRQAERLQGKEDLQKISDTEIDQAVENLNKFPEGTMEHELTDEDLLEVDEDEDKN